MFLPNCFRYKTCTKLLSNTLPYARPRKVIKVFESPTLDACICLYQALPLPKHSPLAGVPQIKDFPQVPLENPLFFVPILLHEMASGVPSLVPTEAPSFHCSFRTSSSLASNYLQLITLSHRAQRSAQNFDVDATRCSKDRAS